MAIPRAPRITPAERRALQKIALTYVPGFENKIRNKPISERLQKVLDYAAAQAGVDVEVYSGGQSDKHTAETKKKTGGWTGSTRHDLGNSADVHLSIGGRRLNFENAADREIYSKFVTAAAAAGATGIGAAVGYMGPETIHVGFGNKLTWGAGGAAKNAPKWLKTAVQAGWDAPVDKKSLAGKAVANVGDVLGGIFSPTGPESEEASRGLEGATRISRKSSPEQIAALQSALISAGFDPGKVDGRFGKQTENAVKAFQKANSLTIDGKPGPRTLERLTSGVAEGPSRLPRPRPNIKGETAAARPAPVLAANSAGGRASRAISVPSAPRVGNAGLPFLDRGSSYATRAPSLPSAPVVEMSLPDFNRAQAIQHGVNMKRVPEMTRAEFNREQAIQRGVNLNTPTSRAPYGPPAPKIERPMSDADIYEWGRNQPPEIDRPSLGEAIAGLKNWWSGDEGRTTSAIEDQRREQRAVVRSAPPAPKLRERVSEAAPTRKGIVRASYTAPPAPRRAPALEAAARVAAPALGSTSTLARMERGKDDAIAANASAPTIAPRSVTTTAIAPPKTFVDETLALGAPRTAAPPPAPRISISDMVRSAGQKKVARGTPRAPVLGENLFNTVQKKIGTALNAAKDAVPKINKALTTLSNPIVQGMIRMATAPGPVQAAEIAGRSGGPAAFWAAFEASNGSPAQVAAASRRAAQMFMGSPRAPVLGGGGGSRSGNYGSYSGGGSYRGGEGSRYSGPRSGGYTNRSGGA